MIIVRTKYKLVTCLQCQHLEGKGQRLVAATIPTLTLVLHVWVQYLQYLEEWASSRKSREEENLKCLKGGSYLT